ncbi:MAG: GNAT family N-acetyltransferase [Anaerolineae bacterium]|nr:GNAT family N-acetyltransferase [Anaerolineae bacterium]
MVNDGLASAQCRGIIVRQMRASDIPGVARAHIAAWRVAFRGILSDRTLDGLRVEHFEGAWQEIIQRENRTNLVAEQGGEILGYVAFGPTHDLQDDARPPGEIYGIYVHPDHWRVGAGRSLMSQALKQLRGQGFTRVIVWTMAGNAISRGFYEKNRFVLDGGERTSERGGERFQELVFTRAL